jgi:hypothetical protein
VVADRNFSWKGTLGEASTIRRALEDRRLEICKKAVDQMTDEEREDVGRIEKLLRIDF